MTVYPECLRLLIDELARLPGIGRKSAERLAFHSIEVPKSEVRALARALTNAHEQICSCELCFGISQRPRCDVCEDPSRKNEILCVVGHSRDVFAMERGSFFRGRYHVLGGVISPLSGFGPDELTIEPLIRRLRTGEVQEVILALNPSTDGETTAMYIADLIKDLDVKTSRIAYGLPVGGELEYTDPVTIARALEGRRKL